MLRNVSYLGVIWHGRTRRAWALRGVCVLVAIVCVYLLVQLSTRRRAEDAPRFKGGFFWQVLYANSLAEQRNYVDAAGAYDRIARDYAGTEVGAEALIYVASMWQAAHERAKAVGTYEKLIKDYPNSPWRHGAKFELQSMATPGKGKRWKDDPVMAEFQTAARLQKPGQYGAAATRYENLSRTYPKHELAPFALLNAGNCYFLMNRPKDAKLRWREVVERYPKSSFSADARFALKAEPDPNMREQLRKALLP